MTVDLILTVITKDKPGVVEKIADVVAQHEGNWVESSMSRLCGQFAGLLRVSVSDSNAAALETALQAMGNSAMSVSVCSPANVAITREAKTREAMGQAARLELTGLDRKGIVLEVTRLLARKNVNVEQLETEVFTASHSGVPMFSAFAEIRIPDELSAADLSAALETIAQDIMVEIDLSEEAEAPVTSRNTTGP